MKKRSFRSVLLSAVIWISLNGCGSSIQMKTVETPTPPPLAKVVAPETKKEIPFTPAPATEIKKEVPPPSAPVPAPKKKKKG